jgi:hypothetical protein
LQELRAPVDVSKTAMAIASTYNGRSIDPHDLLDDGQAIMQQWRNAPSTVTTYRTHINTARKWLAAQIHGGKLKPEYHDAYNIISERSVQVVKTYFTYRSNLVEAATDSAIPIVRSPRRPSKASEVRSLVISTASCVNKYVFSPTAPFHLARLLICAHVIYWQFNDSNTTWRRVSGQWRGNPVHSPQVEELYKSLKNREARSGDRSSKKVSAFHSLSTCIGIWHEPVFPTVPPGIIAATACPGYMVRAADAYPGSIAPRNGHALHIPGIHRSLLVPLSEVRRDVHPHPRASHQELPTPWIRRHYYGNYAALEEDQSIRQPER